MNSNGSTLRTIVLLIGFALLFVAFYLALGHFKTFIRFQAISDCNNIGYIEEVQENGSKVRYPVMDLYQACIDRANAI